MRRFFLIILLTLIILPAAADGPGDNEPKMSVADFRLEEKDMTANTTGTMKMDKNGEKAALIKIETTEKDFLFDVGSLGVEAIEWQNEQHPAEIWLYVPFGVKTITIQHPVLGSITSYDLGQSLKRAKTYRLVLTTSEVNQLVLDYDNLLPFHFDIFPPEASVVLNGVTLKKSNVQQFTDTLPAGKHNYRINAEYYYPESGTFMLDEKEGNQELKVVLRPNYGYLTIPGTKETQGAKVYIDNVDKGTIPLNNVWVKSGDHTLTINQRLYKPYTMNISMTDTATILLNPMLDPNFAEVDFIIDDKDVFIYDNGLPIEFSGNSFHTRLEEGPHQITVKKPNHDDTSKMVTVVSGQPQIVNLDSPVPIYGYLTVRSNKIGARVSLNGKEVGVTPLNNYRVLIGNYDVAVSNSGFKTENQQVTIVRDQLKNLDFELNGWCPAYVSSKPSDAEVYIDGRYVGLTPHQLNLYDGDYNIRVEKKGYRTYSKNRHFDAFTEDFTVRLNPNYISKNEFYLQAGYNIKGMEGLSFGGGFYYKNVDIEFNYIMPLKDTDVIWNQTTGGGSSYSMTYKPEAYDIKIGYGIGLLGRLRFTPFVGVDIIEMKLSDDSYDYMSDLEKASATSITAGLKLDIVPVKHIALYAEAKYMVPVYKDDVFKGMDNIQKVKDFAEGLGVNAGIKFFF